MYIMAAEYIHIYICLDTRDVTQIDASLKALMLHKRPKKGEKQEKPKKQQFCKINAVVTQSVCSC